MSLGYGWPGGTTHVTTESEQTEIEARRACDRLGIDPDQIVVSQDLLEDLDHIFGEYMRAPSGDQLMPAWKMFVPKEDEPSTIDSEDEIVF